MSYAITRFFGLYAIGGNFFLLLLAVFIGLSCGVVAVGFRWLGRAFSFLFQDQGVSALGHLYLLPLLPTAGGLIVGLITWRVREARGSGIPEVMAAAATQDGSIQGRVAPAKAFASAICIGSGGSVGREGPIVHIGAAESLVIGSLFGFSGDRLKILVGCGAVAAITATFNAPIAGAIFALEIILGDFTINTFSPILLSSVLANASMRYLLGNEVTFDVSEYSLVSFYELGFYAVLSTLTGFLAFVFVRVRFWGEDALTKLPMHPIGLPAVGGLIVGLIGLTVPEILGVGYDAIESALLGRIGGTIFLMLLVAKLVATMVSLGSGGIFAPSLFLGATLGGAFGCLVNSMFPALTATSGAYALVGMGALVGATTHDPLTALITLFELTDDYQINLPLMLAVSISTLVSRQIDRESIYTRTLSRRGLNLTQG